ncbi:MAG: hypothetical protein JWQ89_505 [Devosia sp.]|uniref:hypothetical protein n=1 Tax=Devosia sp. TaxID=1871048 RepID=UPI0026030347|nr:hypothetical protein [Devosia sp.]MDB5538778.1 hypothetical protein [Devosia sp.]
MFSHLSRIVAVLALIVGVAEFAMAWSIASGWVGPYEQALARYTAASSSGELINRATRVIAFALALGTLAEIGLALRRKAKGETE